MQELFLGKLTKGVSLERCPHFLTECMCVQTSEVLSMEDISEQNSE